jgi:hypothetical protein
MLDVDQCTLYENQSAFFLFIFLSCLVHFDDPECLRLLQQTYPHCQHSLRLVIGPLKLVETNQIERVKHGCV